MKYFLTLLAVIITCQLHAQTKVERSQNIDAATDKGWTKVLQLKNGNTMLFIYRGKDGIETYVFDKNRKEKARTKITGKNWNAKKIKKTAVAGVYEINGEPVIFLEHLKKWDPVILRLRIHPETGRLVKEDVLMKLPQALGKGNVTVEKDPESDCYAVSFYYWNALNITERYKIAHYDGNHNVINAAYLDPSNGLLKSFSSIGMIVDGNKRLYICSYGISNDKEQKGSVLMSRLNVGDSVFTTKRLDFAEDLSSTTSVMLYNRKENVLQVLTKTLTGYNWSGRKKYYASIISKIDAESMVLKGVVPITHEKMNEYMANRLEKDKTYTGLPQKMILNSDGSTTILHEEIKVTEVRSQGRTGAYYTDGYFSELGNIGVTEIAADGTEQNGYVIIKEQKAPGKYISLYIAERDKGIWHNAITDGTRSEDRMAASFEYINTGQGKYLLFNDNAKNIKKDEAERKKAGSSALEKLNTVCYNLKDGVVSKSYVFGEPDRKRDNNLCLVGASHYMESNHTYATVVLEHEGSKWYTKVAWIQFN